MGLKKPKKIFLGMGDFLEVGDYSKLLDSVFYDEGSVHFEKILDKNNRKIAEMGNIPFSFFKLAVYYPEFLLKESIREKGIHILPFQLSLRSRWKTQCKFVAAILRRCEDSSPTSLHA